MAGEALHTAHLLWAALQRHGAGVVLLTAGGQVHRITEAARDALHDWFGAVPDALPEPLARFVDSGDERLELQDGHRRLVVHRVEADDGFCLLLQAPQTSRAERAATLRLSEREADVLAMLSEGLTLGETADRLEISRATVRKHLEHVYAKLGVHTQAAAVAVYLGRP